MFACMCENEKEMVLTELTMFVEQLNENIAEIQGRAQPGERVQYTYTDRTGAVLFIGPACDVD